jgi:ribokinase
VERALAQYPVEIVVVGLGQAGALLAVRRDNVLRRFPAVYSRPVVSTVGAGDALFSAFIHFYRRDGDPYGALTKAIRFASYKIGAVGAAEGFLTEAEVNNWPGDG